ncbi:MAG TPA: glycoside hydrolase family 9 protein [Gemmatimonadaceae bacterium]|nr:glycoside hydrolase family 9 protein [Gemmatimonadaceae bacterium]
MAPASHFQKLTRRASLALCLLASPLAAQATRAVRVNQLGYLPRAVKVAVVCSLSAERIASFTVEDSAGRVALGPRRARPSGAFAGCESTARLDFSALRTPGRYRVVAAGTSSPLFTIGPNVYRGAADTLLHYMRQQRSGFNPFFGDSVHLRDGILVDDSTRGAQFIRASGGWADASDYLQYVATSATAATSLMLAWRDHPRAFADAFDARGLPGANGVPDVLDEARHGLEWLLRMFNEGVPMLNQLGDDRDHTYLDLPTTDSADYGWGKGKERPLYPCTGRPQGLFKYRNRSTGMASTAGKYAAAFALGSTLFAGRDSLFADSLRRRAAAAYEIGRASPGVCQTAPGRAPYFYEEGNWVDDMELAAAELHLLTRDARYLREGVEYARQEPVTPWMGADTARHYEWYPWHNAGHHELWRAAGAKQRRELAAFYRRGLDAVVARADNGFRIGIPFIWCSNDLVASFATQAHLYRVMTGDTRYAGYEAAALDWLFGTNPWGTSMVIGLPQSGRWPRDPHSVIASQLHVPLTGGLVDGPVKRSIFENLQYIRLTHDDSLAAFNRGAVVYHDDWGDYSTNEPIMDGTANLAYLLASLGSQ